MVDCLVDRRGLEGSAEDLLALLRRFSDRFLL